MILWHRAIEKVKKSILSLSTIVEEQLNRAMLSLERKDVELANETIKRDKEIDDLEIFVEEECLKILALYQPVAEELRFLVAVLKMNNDLERIGDLAANIAKRTLSLTKFKNTEIIAEFKNIGDKVKIMVKRSIDALITTDVQIAKIVLESDDEIDMMTKQMLNWLIEEIKKHPEKTKEYFQIRSISKSLERIADSATNIAEDVVYLCTGEIIRHRGEDFFSDETDQTPV
jgi:phosphate transport system protein